MKISGVKPGSVGRAGKGKSSGKTSSSKLMSVTSATTTDAADSVSVTDPATTMDLIRNLVADSPDIRVDEVDRIIQQMKQGKFKIDFEKVAEGFIKEALLSEIAKKPRKKQS